MNTPINEELDQTGISADAGTKPRLRTTNWGGHRPGAFERVLFKVNVALRPLIAAHLTEEHSFLFADPVTDADSGEVHWYAPIAGEAVSYMDLAPQDQAALDAHVNQLLFDLLELARKLQTEAKTLEHYVAGQLLELQLDSSYSQKECLYVVGYQPVFAFWAFESGQTPDTFAPPREVFIKHEGEAPLRREPQAVDSTPAARPQPRPQRLRIPQWSARQLAVAAGVLGIAFLAIFGLNPRQTVVSWLDRLEATRAREQALLRIIARDERARAGGVSEAELDAEIGAAGAQQDAAAQPQAEAPPQELEELPEPMPPFESAGGKLPIEKLQGSILLLHFWNADDPEMCAEITSFVSMVTSENFDPLRELGGEAYLITSEESVEKGGERLKACGVQDPYLLRDPGGAILRAIAADAKPPVTLVFDKLTERTLKTYAREDWLNPKMSEELQRLFLMQAF